MEEPTGQPLQDRNTGTRLPLDGCEKAIEMPDKNPKQIHHFYFVKLRPSSEEIRKEEAHKQYELMKLARPRIVEEICQLKAQQHEINKKLTWFSLGDEHIEWKAQEIKILEQYLDKEEPCLPMKSMPRRTAFLDLTGKDAHIPGHVGIDRKRCQNRLKKERMDMGYLQLVQEELLSSKKSDGTTLCGRQELNDLITSLVQRTQHGNSNRAEEIKIYHEMRKVEETREMYTAPDPPRYRCSWKFQESKRDRDWKREVQHIINIRLDDIEKIKRNQMGRKARVTRLKAELELVRKNISSLEKELENVSSKRDKAHESAYGLGEKTNEQKSCYSEYQSLMINAKELARKGDVLGLKELHDRQVEEFMRHWSSSKAFREEYERRELVPNG